MDKESFVKLLKKEILEDWETYNTKYRVRSIFTTMCIIFDLESDTKETDDLLYMLYEHGAIGCVGITLNEFENFMLEYIV